MSDLSEVPTTSRWSLQLGFWSSALFSAHPLFTKMSCADNLRCCATPEAQLIRSSQWFTRLFLGGLPESKSFANIGAPNRSARFWSAAVLCRFAAKR